MHTMQIDDVWLKPDGTIAIDTEFAPSGEDSWHALRELAKQHELKIKIPRGSVVNCLEAIEGQPPLSLTTTMEDRDRLLALYSHPKVKIDQEAREVILKALQDSEKIAPPILKPTDYELIGYIDEVGELTCKETQRFALPIRGKVQPFVLAKGKTYTATLRAEPYVESFTRPKVHWNAVKKEKTKLVHECELHGKDTIVIINLHQDWSANTEYIAGELVHHDYYWMRCKEDHKSGETFDKDKFTYTNQSWREVQFRKHVDQETARRPELDEEIIWDIFDKPVVKTVAEKYPEQYQKNKDTIGMMELFGTGDWKWYDDQLDYIARMGCVDSGIIAAETGAGKSAMGIALIQCKAPGRTLLIAPKGTVKDDDATLDVAQWAGEFEKFSPTTPVYKIFNESDFFDLVNENNGEAPYGVYITYDYVMFRKDALETRPGTWTASNQEKMMRKACGLPKYKLGDVRYSENIGKISDGELLKVSVPNPDHHGGEGSPPPYNVVDYVPSGGFKCVAKPCLAQKIGQIWDMVVVDEAHVMKNPNSQITRALTMLQAQYKFCLTATPIPNYVTDIFMLMGWVCVPDFWRGNRSNPRWPFTRQQIGKFGTRFLSREVDLTQRELNRRNGKGASPTKESAIINEPPALLKLLKTGLGFISKEMCNPDLVKCNLKDVRVEMSAEQEAMYSHYLDFENVPAVGSQLYCVQMQYLRGACASPTEGKHAENYPDVLVPSPFNQKILATLQVVLSCIQNNEQCVVVYARKGQANEIQSRLHSAGITTSRIDSTTKHHSRESNYFKQGRSQVMLMGILCAQGYSFNQCSNLVISSLDWSYGKFNQALGRVFRLNSAKDANIYSILIKDSIEEMIYDRLITKEDTATICLRGERRPRNVKEVSEDDLIAEHLFEWKSSGAKVSEYQLERSVWPEMRDRFKGKEAFAL